MNEIHPSWEFMRPNKNEKYEDFRFEGYYRRMSFNKKLNHIPRTIFDQWIYYQHQEPNTLNNYGWINYEKIQFEIEEWSYDRFLNVSVIKNFMDYYISKGSCSDFGQFCCIPEDLKYWKEEGTWRVPPIVLDINSLMPNIPSWSDLTAPYQLVEGHTRFGYLQSLKRISDLNKGSMASTHRIYLMKHKS